MTATPRSAGARRNGCRNPVPPLPWPPRSRALVHPTWGDAVGDVRASWR